MALDIEREAQQAITLIKSFNLEFEQYGPESQVLYWLNKYRALWIRDAIIEAVYQGRYKIISVEHILTIWQRRGQPVRHFTSGFEQVIAAQLGTSLRLSTTMMSPLATPADNSTKAASGSPAPNLPAHRGPDASEHPSPPLSSTRDQTGTSIAAFSIEAFPTAAFDTLVEVYQASTPAHEVIKQLNNANLDDLGVDIPRFNREAPMHLQPAYPKHTSEPIQPFRPTSSRQPA